MPKDLKVNEPELDKQSLLMAMQCLINPSEDKLSEVSFLPVGALHSLTMLQTYEGYLSNLYGQTKELIIWYMARELRRKVVRKEITAEDVKQQLEASKVNLANQDESTSKSDKLFIHYFRMSYYQHSRGKEGEMAKIIQILADTQMQVQSDNPADEKIPGRFQ